MRSLCIDTSTIASVALVEEGRLVGQGSDPHPRRHAESLATITREALRPLLGPSADTPDALKRADISRICVGTGPGPYTGLRAGIAFAVALGRGLGLPVYGVGSQEGLALSALENLASADAKGMDGLRDRALSREMEVVVVTDAKRKEIYWGRYSAVWSDGASSIIDVDQLDGPNVGPVEDVLALMSSTCPEPAPLVGPESVGSLQVEVVAVDPAALSKIVDARIARLGESAQFPLAPLYLRRPDVHVKVPQPSAPTP